MVLQFPELKEPPTLEKGLAHLYHGMAGVFLESDDELMAKWIF